MLYEMGVIGLGVMGENLALNMERRGFPVAGFDLDEEKRKAAAAKWAGKKMAAAASLDELAGCLSRPRRMLMMVPAGKPVDAVIHDLKPLLSPGDVLIDGGNSFFEDTERRGNQLAADGVLYIGAGISGGEEGALHGPSIMPGGQPEAYRHVEPILTAIAARTGDGPCCTYIGKGGAGHYVKMVHNGIEYGILQLISEAYDLMRTALGMGPSGMRQVFSAWNQTELNSYLIEITAAVLAETDPETGRPLVDVILDRAGQKGTGKWTAQNALDLGVAVPAVDAALQARIISALKDERVEAARILRGPAVEFDGNKESFLETLRRALHLAILTCYAQGFALMREASKEYGTGLRLAEIARIWKGGCIIRARLLDGIQSAFAEKPDLPNLLIDARFSPVVNEAQGALRTAVGQAARLGVPCLGLAASLGYIDSYRRERLPANLLQALRDYFGAHRYERVDRPRGETFHTGWSSGREIR